MDPRRDILIVTGGSSPQVVTETIYALLRRSEDPFVPSKILCVITRGVAAAFEGRFQAALDALKCQFALSKDWSCSKQTWREAGTGLFIEFPRLPDGSPVDDIRMHSDAVAFGDFISEIVRVETLDPQCRVHLSIAGGRRTMSFHGGAAMSLFGRPQDELSHVLVEPAEFERCPDFWFPPDKAQLVKHLDGRLLDARKARVSLTMIPFVRVRSGLPPNLLAHGMNYAEHVAQANAALGTIRLELELVTSERRVRIGGLANFTLPNTEFALYQLMAEWKLNSYKGASPHGIGPSHAGWLTARMFRYPDKYRPNPIKRFFKIYEDTFKTGTDQADDIGNTITATPTNDKQRQDNETSFGQWKSRLVAALRKHVHQADLADRFGAPPTPIRVRTTVDGVASNRHVFGLRLEPGEILIRS